MSPIAESIRTFYELALDTLLEEFQWPFAKKKQALAIIEENPTDEWAYSYKRPADCVSVHRILSASWPETEEDAIPFEQANSTYGTVIYCNESDATLQYTEHVVDESLYPAYFVNALALLLAVYSAPAVTGGDNFNLAGRAERGYKRALNTAVAKAGNEERVGKFPDAEVIRARE